MVAVLFLAGIGALAAGYLLYGRALQEWLGVEPGRPTPAHAIHEDADAAADPGVRADYVPARAPVLFGHHFSSIAGAGPIAGPIFAAMAFGWAPVAVWIVLGAIFIGGVQDFSSLMASIRHRARSIGEISRHYLSPLGYRLLLTFIYLALVYVVIVFIDLTSTTFASSGGVASSSILYVALAVVFGLLLTRVGMPLWLGTAIFVPLVFLGIWGGQLAPVRASATTWDVLLLAYCFGASVLPVWLLLQPRDYLSSYLLFACLAAGVVGILAGAIAGSLTVQTPAWRGFVHPTLGAMFPVLFITVACGATSGFHTIVASGTTAKQLDREADARPIAYGGMLLEGVLALLALVTVVVIGGTSGKPTLVFAEGMGRFVGALGLDPSWGTAFGLLAISTFLLTTLDTCTRLGRYIFEELTGMKGHLGRYVATAVTVGAPAIFLLVPFTDAAGKVVAPWKVIWPVFGATNQLLGALAMVVVVLWLRDRGRRTWFVALPCAFMIAVTVLSLTQMTLRPGPAIVRVVAGLLLALSIAVVVEALRVLLRGRPADVAGRTT